MKRWLSSSCVGVECLSCGVSGCGEIEVREVEGSLRRALTLGSFIILCSDDKKIGWMM